MIKAVKFILCMIFLAVLAGVFALITIFDWEWERYEAFLEDFCKNIQKYTSV